MASMRRTGLQVCLFAATMACILSGCGGARARLESHLHRGQEYLASGNLDKASVEFRNAGQIEPKNAAALYFNGRVAEARNNIPEAFGFYQAAIDADPKYAAARAGAGKMLVFAGSAKRALDVIDPGLAEHPGDVDLLAVRAAARHELKENDTARADAERAVQLGPTNENALSVLAALYAEAREYPRAITLMTGAIARAPASVPLREVLTNLYLVSGQPGEAEEQMRKVIELKPLELAPRSQLATHLTRARNLDAAQRVLEEAIEALSRGKQDLKANEAKLLLVDFVSRERSREQGEKTLRDFIAREPENFDLRLGLGALLQRAGAAAEALAAYQEVLKRDGTGAKGLIARDRMAAIQLTQGHADAARRLLAEVLQKNPRDDDALILRATLEMQQNDPTGAIGDLRAVLRNRPGSVALQRALAGAYLAKGQPALAEETLRAAMQTAPNDATVRIELAEVLARTDRAAQGITVLEETVKLLPDDAPAREGLVRAYLAAGNLQGARDAAEELKRRQPQSAAGYYYAGLVAAQERRLDESQSNFESALKLQPHRLDVLSSLARVEVARGAYAAAIGRVQTEIEQDPNNVTLLNLLGGLYFERKDFNHAADTFARVSALDPRLWQPHRSLALVKLAANDPEGAVNEYEAALKLAPAEPQLVADAARVYEKQGRIDAAIAGYEALYEGNPQVQQFAANNLAMLLVTYRKDQASLDRARDLTSGFITSTDGSLLDTVGWVRFKRGEYRDALAPLERAAERTPDSKVIRFHLGMAELQLGLRDRARTNLELALAGSDSFQGADEARTVLATLKARA
ncbi:MAG TPA: tetratricopeptide repeat protein [Steroidobacteraceae bacterium]|nr:tetratricopeptide repeat protein [Steroidobacteraceae bacterium]